MIANNPGRNAKALHRLCNVRMKYRVEEIGDIGNDNEWVNLIINQVLPVLVKPKPVVKTSLARETITRS
jgi:hypothetical protein